MVKNTFGPSIKLLEESNKKMEKKIESAFEAYETYKQMAENCLKEIDELKNNMACNIIAIAMLKEKEEVNYEIMACEDDTVSSEAATPGSVEGVLSDSVTPS